MLVEYLQELNGFQLVLWFGLYSALSWFVIELVRAYFDANKDGKKWKLHKN